MRFKRLRTETEFERYRASFAEVFARESKGRTADLPVEYLRASMPFGVFDRNGEMVAGYTLAIGPRLRLLEFVPAEARAKLVVPGGKTWADCCEITVAWKRPEVTALFMASRFWPRTVLGVLATGKPFLLGHNQSERLDKFYTGLGPKTLYAGPSSFGLPSRLFVYGRTRMILSVLLLWSAITPWRAVRSFVGGGK
ncbi:MAG: hypothetical protein JST04_12550 [Bdellovibrionales bacterium]|nr:hypothetical protein [Bdellovibrionales bacterium]